MFSKSADKDENYESISWEIANKPLSKERIRNCRAQWLSLASEQWFLMGSQKECQSHGRPQGGAKRAFPPPLEIGTKEKKFLENVKSAV